MPSPMKVRDVIKLVVADGWELVRTKGSHRQYHHPTKRGTVTIPGKPSDTLQSGLLSSIFKQAQLEEK